MRMLLNVEFPHEPFNAAVRDGSVGAKIARIMEAIKPEAAYFIEQNGRRTAILIVQVEQSAQIPALAEPWFLQFNADCQFRIAMTAEDLQQAGLEALGKQWA